MKYKNSVSRTFPRLTIERSETSPTEYVGFLQVGASARQVEIGRAESREFRLVQCLFSPKNFLSAKYEPVIQTHERLFGAIRVSTDASNRRLATRENAEHEMTAIVEKSLRNLRQGEAGGYLAFVSEGGKARMEVVGRKGALL